MAIGAIVGGPFLLATIAMMLVGLSALGYRQRRRQGRKLAAHAPTLERDLGFFLCFFALATILGLGAPQGVRIFLAFGFVSAYALYVRRTLHGGGEVEAADSIHPLILARHTVGEPTRNMIGIQFLVGLGAMVGGAHMFVVEVLELASWDRGGAAYLPSLVFAPLATELPEKANSSFWVRDGKDSLALGNITGAMVFQSTMPVAFGLAFTTWELDRFAILSAALGLAGGIVAYWALRLQGRFSVPAILAWGALYARLPALRGSRLRGQS